MTDTRTFMARKETVQRDWYVIDATGISLGRLASRVALVLMGKHKPTYTPHVDTGDFVIIINAEKVGFTGNKLRDKRVYRHSGYPGGFRSSTYAEIMAKHPTRLIEKVVKGMLPKNKLGSKMLKKLRVYKGAEHGHAAQQPTAMEL